MTAQFTDGMKFEGKQYALFANTLEEYFETNPPRPNFRPSHTANWRGYVASWEIRDDKLYLVRLYGEVCSKDSENGASKSVWCPVGHNGDCVIEEVGLDDLFVLRDGAIFADWVTDELRCPVGEVIKYSLHGYGTKYERYLMIRIRDGAVLGTRIIESDNYEKEKEERWPAQSWLFQYIGMT